VGTVPEERSDKIILFTAISTAWTRAHLSSPEHLLHKTPT
jgi:hypothetical protein